ncbi:MAG: pyruvate kinase alpha/beta domain-containing protein [Petrotogales bacterium]
MNSKIDIDGSGGTGFVERRVIYFNSPGRKNTESVLKLAEDYARAEGIKDIVVASTLGETGVKASELFKDFNLVVVTHHVGHRKPGEWEFKEENRKKILDNGAKIVTAAHVLSGVERAILKKFHTIMPLEIMAYTLRLFGEGTKACIECTIMAADAGLIPVDRNVVAIAGTQIGIDTALVIRPACSSDFFDIEIREIIAKPRFITSGRGW